MMYLAMLPTWLKLALGGALLGLVVFWAGGMWEARNAALEAAEKRVDTLKQVEKDKHDVESLDDDDIARELRDRLSDGGR